jgi:hypothetical protein
MERVVVVSDAEPDDLIALRLLLLTLRARKVLASQILVLATLRNARESAHVLDKIIAPLYPELRALVGTSNSKKPFTDASGLLICATPRSHETEPDAADTKETRTGIEEMCAFVASAKPKSVDVLVLAPAIDLNRDILKRLPAENVRGIWAWGGMSQSPRHNATEPAPFVPAPLDRVPVERLPPTSISSDYRTEPHVFAVDASAIAPLDVSDKKEFVCAERQEEKRAAPAAAVRQIAFSDVSDKSASFNWRSAPVETVELLQWSQEHHVPFTIATPCVYQTTSAWANFVGVTEENNPAFAKLLREKPDLKLIATWIKQWNEICPDAVKVRCNLRPGSLQFTPADPVAVAVYLWPDSMIAARESVHLAPETVTHTFVFAPFRPVSSSQAAPPFSSPRAEPCHHPLSPCQKPY